MRQPISITVRRQVMQRAGSRYEYCRLHQDDSFLAFEIDHVAPVKHGGGNELANLALACPHCNQNKGSDMTTFLDDYQDIVSLFNPRFERWDAHFDAVDGEIVAKTRVGQASIKLFRLNEPDRLIIRQLLTQSGRYP